MSIVKEYTIENTTIEICDDAYIGRTQEDIEASIKRIKSLIIKYYNLNTRINNNSFPSN